MNTVPTIRPSWEVAHSLGSILWRQARSSYEIRLRERPREPQRSTYVRGERSPETYELAERELARRITATGRGEREISRSLTVGAWLDEWLELQIGQKGNSRTAYEARIELYLRPVLGRHRLADLEPADVARAMRRLAAPIGTGPNDRPMPTGRTAKGTPRTPRVALLSTGTIDAAFRVLDDALGDAWAMGRAPRNACRGVDVARPDTLVEPPSLEELELLFAVLRGETVDEHGQAIPADPWLAVFALMRETGARVGEVLGLERRNVDLEARIVTYSRQRANRRGASTGLGSLKSRASRRPVGIPAYLVELLEPWYSRPRIDSPLLFTTSTGRPLDARNVLRHFDTACERAGIRPSEHADLEKYRPHDLRHAFATTAIAAGVHEPIVAAWLGHASTAMLKRYAHVKPMPGGAAYRHLAETWGEDLELAFGIRSPRRESAVG